MQNFTVSDLVQTTWASFAFALFFLPPGYLLGWTSNAFEWRRRSAAEKLLFSVLLSFAATPVIAVLLIRLFSYKVALAFFLLLALISLWKFWQAGWWRKPFVFGARRSTWLLLCMALAWFFVVQFSLADLQVGHHLYVSSVFYDYSLRIPMVEAAARDGVPPLNPFFGLGKVPVLRYYYYWYVVCALPKQLFGIGAKGCLNASVFWSGLGLASAVPLFLKYFLCEKENIRSKSVIGVALLAVTGLDLLPFTALGLIGHGLPAFDLEWWDLNQVTSWIGALLWVPHHVASLTACMSGLLVMSSVEEESSWAQKAWAVVLSGLAFASAAGLSIYVTFTFGLFVICWALWVLSQKLIKTFLAYVATGAVSLTFSWPYLCDLLSRNSGSGGAPASVQNFAFISIRSDPEILASFARLVSVHDSLALEFLKLPVLLLLYFLEFGFFFFIFVLRCRQDASIRKPLKRQERIAWLMFAVCLLTMSVVQSGATNINDLGCRGMLVVQFVLLIWAAPIVYDVFFVKRDTGNLSFRSRWVRMSLEFAIVLGLAGSACQLILMRCYAPLADAGKLARLERIFGDPGFGERTYWLREGYTRLGRLALPTTFVQYNPVRDEVLLSHLYSAQQAVMGDAGCASAIGGDYAECRKAFPVIALYFNDPLKARETSPDDFCDEFHINVLVAIDTDPVWQDPGSWVWNRQSLISNSAMRAIPCGSKRSLAKSNSAPVPNRR